MTFVVITKPSLGTPTKKSLIDSVIDNITDLNARLSTVNGAVPNTSFELDTDSDGEPDGWTVTVYTGGSYALTTSQKINGGQSLSFTSTSTANGGGQAIQDDFFTVSGGKYYAFEGWLRANGANVSSRIEVVWYDQGKNLIGSDNIANLTNTPTTFTQYGASFQAPSTARYAKMRVTGGVPGVGSATGTIYVDGLVVLDIPAASIVEQMIAASAVTQSKLKTSTASGSITISTTGTQVALTGGSYAWWTGSANIDGAPFANVYFGAEADTAAGTLGLTAAASATFFRDERYVQACPPYTHGPIFIYLLINADKSLAGIDVGFDPTWAYHGPTDITPQSWRGGRQFRKIKLFNGEPFEQFKKRPDWRELLLQQRVDITEGEVEITLAYKDSDMQLAPHPWFSNKPNYLDGRTAVLLEPGTPLMLRLAEMGDLAGAREVRDIVRNNYLQFDNEFLDIPGFGARLRCVRARMRLTR